MTYQPPKCPECGSELDHVDETEYNVYTFNPKTGTYDEDGTLTVSCPYCEYDLGGNTEEFGDGACNYVSKAKGGGS